MPWFPGDPEPQPDSGGVEDRAPRGHGTFHPTCSDGAAPQPGDAAYLPHRRLTMLSGHVYPAAVQPIGPVTGRFYGDAGDGEHQLRGGFVARYPQDAGRDTPADTPARGQGFVAWSPPLWGMNDAATEYRNRYLVALDEPSAAGRPQFAPRSFAMRPSATAIPVLSQGQIPQPGGTSRRQVAAGRVTRWEQPSLVWPEYGPKGG